jgi:hypothetical protein
MIIQTLDAKKAVIATVEVEEVSTNPREQVHWAVECARDLLHSPDFKNKGGANVRVMDKDRLIWMTYHGMGGKV